MWIKQISRVFFCYIFISIIFSFFLFLSYMSCSIHTTRVQNVKQHTNCANYIDGYDFGYWEEDHKIKNKEWRKKIVYTYMYTQCVVPTTDTQSHSSKVKAREERETSNFLEFLLLFRAIFAHTSTERRTKK